MSDKWRTVPLRDIGKWLGGGTPSKANPAFWENGTIPWVSPKDMKTDRIASAEDMITEAAVQQSTTNLVPAGSVLMVTRSGILRHSFPVAVTDVPVTLNQDLKALTPATGVLPKYVLFALKAFNRNILHTCSKQGTTVNSIETEKLLSFEIPLAPLERQAEIVAEIEKQLSRLDEAVTGLKRIQTNLKRYKAAVLKAAVEGTLTEQWHKEHPNVEPADQLLKRILAERRAKWEAEELAKILAKGIKPKDDSWKKKYKEPAGPDTVNLPELPEGWVWANFEQLSERVTVGHVGSMKNEYADTGIPFLRSQNVRENRFDSAGLKFISKEFHETLNKSALEPGDLVVVRSGSVGVACVIPESLREANCSDLVIVKRPFGILADYGAYFMNSNARKWVKAQQVGVALTHFNTQSMAAMPVPTPCVQEQKAIIEEVASRLSVTEELETTIETSLKRAERLRQTILSKHFTPRTN